MMKIYQYKCELLSDLIISSISASEGQSKSLDYIPGSKFLGIVASKIYDTLSENEVIDIFHNGVVSFGNAYPQVEGNNYLPIPSSYFFPKGKSLQDEVLLPMNMSPGENYLDENEKLVQPKQARGGYFNYSKSSLFNVNQSFRLKSAYDAIQRRSKDGQMFGYFSLPKGLVLHFTIIDSNGNYSEIIKNQLTGTKRIGRSRSAEYGLVDIKLANDKHETVNSQHANGTEQVIYAKSDLCFLDEYGQFTTTPSSKDLSGNEENRIIWEKCQIRSRKFPVWNGIRRSKDSDRIIIEKGSVFTIQLSKAVSDNFYEKGIGVLISEGYGHVIVNPSFIPLGEVKMTQKFSKIADNSSLHLYPDLGRNPAPLIQALKSKMALIKTELSVKEEVDRFIKEKKSFLMNPSKSQWGTIRGYAKQSKNYQVFWKITFEKELGFIHRGKSEIQWRKTGSLLMDKLEELMKNRGESFAMNFIQKLSTEITKLTK